MLQNRDGHSEKQKIRDRRSWNIHGDRNSKQSLSSRKNRHGCSMKAIQVHKFYKQG